MYLLILGLQKSTGASLSFESFFIGKLSNNIQLIGREKVVIKLIPRAFPGNTGLVEARPIAKQGRFQ